MKNFLILILLALAFSCKKSKTINSNTLTLTELKEPVELVRDKWGINHIYAQNQHDLFFTQGYAAAADRLFQFEIWRRQATGTVSEILGERELKRDIGTRLFKFRGDMTTEMNHYHNDGVEIITAYTNGVNAYIDNILKTPELLPIEFKILDIKPQKWTPEVVISRHQGLLGNINEELQIARTVTKLGAAKTKELFWLHPKDPDIEIDPLINKSLLDNDILELYNAYRKTVKFEKEDIIPSFRNTSEEKALTHLINFKSDSLGIGSNNWVVNGSQMKDGHTYMANDPHRTIAIPSLRYMTHLVAPGWDVIGGGEPEIPGISIGHNEYGAWGLTVFETDGEDLYVYELNPENQNQYKHKDHWVDMTHISETIKIKGQKDSIVDLAYTLHGPVTFIDKENNVAYAVRCAWLEPGGSPYLASLRMNQAENWEEFREACTYSHIPGENMIWADTKGNIGWQAVGIAPIRKNFSGLVPVPGDGRFEWDGYLPIIEKPNAFNPEKGYIATANENVTSNDFTHWDAIGYSWADPYRGERIKEVLESGKKMTMDDMKALQTDYLSIPARTLVPLLLKITFDDRALEAKDKLNNWNYKLESNSIPAAIYVAWEEQIMQKAYDMFVPKAGKGIVPDLQVKRVLDWVLTPDSKFGANPIKGRNEFLADAFKEAITKLESKLGTNMEHWQYGQENNKHTYMEHALSSAVDEKTKNNLDLGPLPRGGNGQTVGSTGGNSRQSSGASFRVIINTGNWDSSFATNGPGQSGNPNSQFYNNLFEPWAKDEYFPLYYSKSKIDSVAVSTQILNPKEK
ncbi:penicillin acylase family protein [Maribacter hydrothermalis]|uniref:Peptidase S45 n=1 Tax=Maribacter hydrothermalis TaxID=1836467 RepID=A0A1B7ZDE7_9FLAO|nr:penicillin acylase family protein [Maribacter hydrothermalis]APQ18432.1 penicillin acylase family protein [Maribacter hydrothermalis]OBR41361.1 peptidase S45 [Maribacter hydrothermalis]